MSLAHNNKALSEFIRFHQYNFAYDPFVIWDLNNKCLYASEVYLKYIGVSDLVGKSLSEVSDEYAILSKEFQINVVPKLLETKEPLICFFLLANTPSDTFGMHTALLFPIFDEEHNLIAYCSRSNKLRHDEPISKILQVFSSDKQAKSNFISKITEREKMVIFLLIVGLSHKEIAYILSDILNKPVSQASITVMINRQIYPKFNTNTPSSLLQQAILHGLLYDIPAPLVSKLPRVLFVEEYAEFCKHYGLILKS